MMTRMDETMAAGDGISAPRSRELADLFQEAFAHATGQGARWAAETVQGNRHFDRAWCVPFTGDNGLRGHFSLRWDSEFQRYLAGRCGAAAQRPEYLGAVLRAMAGRVGHPMRPAPVTPRYACCLRRRPWPSRNCRPPPA